MLFSLINLWSHFFPLLFILFYSLKINTTSSHFFSSQFPSTSSHTFNFFPHLNINNFIFLPSHYIHFHSISLIDLDHAASLILPACLFGMTSTPTRILLPLYFTLSTLFHHKQALSRVYYEPILITHF